MIISSGRYLNAKVRSRLFNIAAIALVVIDIVFFINLFFDNIGNSHFLEIILDPFAIGLLILPLLVAGVFMFLSKRADREMLSILKKLREGKGK